jgi:tetratricopeptide (TPR) repeat protein
MKSLLLSALLLFHCLFVRANEGMWIPSLLNAAQIGEMQSMGMKLTAEDIYSVNKGSLKDAICQFGGGCTAEVISYQGLILTNHHCGYSQIQEHSTLEHDYLTNGFWAMSKAEELPNPGLTAMFVVRIEDVTAEVLDSKSEADARKRFADIISKATQGTHYKAEILPFNYGNAYFMIVTETFTDVRLVGAPPGSIGKYGHDTDNWVWPRHTGDFSIFRIYAGKDNKPAPYSPENIPYVPKHSLPVSMEGVKPGDFTMVYGFPGRTQQFLPSFAVEYILNHGNPAKINMRDHSLAVITGYMKQDKLINIQYASKQSRIANAWKKWIGETFGLKRTNALQKKFEFEKEFQSIANKSDSYKKYRNILPTLQALYEDSKNITLAADYYFEYFYYGPEILRYATTFDNLFSNYATMSETDRKSEIEKLLANAAGYFKNYNTQVDKDIFASLTEIFHKNVAPEYLPELLNKALTTSKNNYSAYTELVYTKSVFTSEEKINAILSKPSAKVFSKIKSTDPAFLLANAINQKFRTEIKPGSDAKQQEIVNQLFEYVKAIKEMMPDRKYWFDANSTLRLTYGKVEGSAPFDGMKYEPFTTLDGVIAKYKPGDFEFDLPAKLIDLYNAKDYGPYAENGKLYVCFTGSNHTTGGNSGSPAINGEGFLVGLNFDRSWESTMSDVMYNGDICRNIMVDVRYILFIIDKFAGAGHLLNEMDLITTGKRMQMKKEKAMKEVEALSVEIRNNSKSADLLINRGDIYHEMEMYSEALVDYEAALRINKEHFGALKSKGITELRSGKCFDAVTTLTKAIALNNKDADAHFQKGLALYEKGDYKQAITSFNETIKLAPDHHKAYYNRGVCRHLLGEIAAGCDDFKMAQKLGSNMESWIYENVCSQN